MWMNVKWRGLNFTPLIAMNIQEGGQEKGAVCFILVVESQVLSCRKQRWSNDRERERAREGDACVGFERNCSWLSWIFIPF